jgi:hypothetical protein
MNLFKGIRAFAQLSVFNPFERPKSVAGQQL